MNSLVDRFDRALISLVLLGVASYCLGTALNAAALVANGDSMSVIGLRVNMPVDGPKTVETISNSDGRPRHASTVGDTRLSFLVDHIRIKFPDIRTSLEPFRLIRVWARLLDYPLEGGINIVSIGDLTRWIGSALFLLILPVLIVRIPFRLVRDGIRFQR